MASMLIGGLKKVGNWLVAGGALASRRPLAGTSQLVFTVLGIFFAAFFLYTAGPPFLGAVNVGTKRGLFMLLMTIMIIMKYPATSKSPQDRISLFDGFLIILSIICFGYWMLYFDAMVARAGSSTRLEIVLGTIAILLSLESSRRVLGIILPLVGAFFLAYAYLGNYFGWSVLSSAGFSWSRIVSDAYSMNGIFGMVLDIIVTYVALFVLFGSLMQVFGADAFFIEFPYSMTAGLRGGPAKTAVVASGLFGSISGSATANTAATGAFTIPLMIKTGYPREIAGAIEPAASTGGMFMPPVMGAGTFLMADMLKIPYGQIVKVAIVPAIIYFFSVWMIAHYQALAKHIPIIPKEERPQPWAVFRRGWYYAIPILLLLYLLLSYVSPSRAIYWTIVVTIVLSIGARLVLRKQPALDTLKESGRDLLLGLRNGAEDSLTISAVVGTTGIIIGMVLLTGLAFTFTTSVMSVTGGLLPVGILMALLAGYVLGMGMTVTSVYILLAILVVPALVKLGMDPLAAHFLVFWFSQTSNISPPVCVAAFVGAGIAKANPYKVGFNSFQFAAFIFVMPLLFAYSEILMPNGLTYNAIVAMASGFLATIPYAAAVCGYFRRPLNVWQRALLMLSAVLLVLPSLSTTVIGLGLTLLTYWLQSPSRIPPVLAKTGT